MKILILEDTLSRINDFKKNTIGHNICFVEKISTCIDKLENEGPWDYLFLDHDLDHKVFVPSGPGTGYEVAEWLKEHPNKKPAIIILHSLNEKGVQKMSELLPEAYIEPNAWIRTIEERSRFYKFLDWYKENGKGRSSLIFSSQDLLWQGWKAALDTYRFPVIIPDDCTCTIDQYAHAMNPKCIIHGEKRQII